VRVISLDLLGFGNSPRPAWATYSVRTQARSVIATLASLKLRGRVTLVGHSLGSLVAVEVTKRYSPLVRSLVLCSPPFYDEYTDTSILLIVACHKAKRTTYRVVYLDKRAMKYYLLDKSFHVIEETIAPYLVPLGARILKQSSLHDTKKI